MDCGAAAVLAVLQIHHRACLALLFGGHRKALALVGWVSRHRHAGRLYGKNLDHGPIRGRHGGHRDLRRDRRRDRRAPMSICPHVLYHGGCDLKSMRQRLLLCGDGCGDLVIESVGDHGLLCVGHDDRLVRLLSPIFNKELDMVGRSGNWYTNTIISVPSPPILLTRHLVSKKTN